MIALCPACGLREATDKKTGWCKVCAGESFSAGYEERKALERRERWALVLGVKK